MQTSSSAAPDFSARTLVCTALSHTRLSGMVHHLVSDTTGPAAFRYHLVAAKPRKTVPHKADRP